MAEKRFKRVIRPATAEERERHAAVRRVIVQEYPPAEGSGRRESPPGIPTQIRQAREAQGLTWYALAKRAGIPNANTVRDIEHGRDAQLSTVQAVAHALGGEPRIEGGECVGEQRASATGAGLWNS